ncbi:hypothetical protein R5R35_014459 [Gryllus longicercus]|uniref:Uncharacterized protein n=1 Tax=Gryllus longicercus TaxID=2509291 RepID=A0AAN9Z069_9ORTH
MQFCRPVDSGSNSLNVTTDHNIPSCLNSYEYCKFGVFMGTPPLQSNKKTNGNIHLIINKKKKEKKKKKKKEEKKKKLFTINSFKKSKPNIYSSLNKFSLLSDSVHTPSCLHLPVIKSSSALPILQISPTHIFSFYNLNHLAPLYVSTYTQSYIS